MSNNSPKAEVASVPDSTVTNRFYYALIALGVFALVAFCVFYGYELVQMNQDLTWHDIYTAFLKS